MAERESVEQTNRENAFQILVNNAADAISMINMDGDLTYANRAFYEMLGLEYEKEELIGKRLRSIIPERGLAKMEEVLQQALSTGSWSGEAKMKRQDGRLLDISLTAFPLLDESERTIALAAIMHEITAQKQVEEALRESEMLFRSIVENSPTGIFIVNADYQFIYGNEELSRILGYSTEEIMGLDFRQMLDEESKRSIAERYTRRQRGEEVPSRYELDIIRKDGEKRRLEMSAVAIEDSEGNPQTIAQVVDITERKRAVESLAQSESQYEALVDNIQDGVFLIQDSKMRFVNKAFAQMVGYKTDEIIGMDFTALIAPEDLHLVAENYRKRQAGEPVPDSYEWRMLKKDGETRVEVNMAVTVIEYQGKPASLGTVKDITLRKQAEERIRESLERRARQVMLTTEIAQEITATTDLEELYHRVVTLIKERFDYYHTQIFRHDPEADTMVVVEGYGDAGEKMKADRNSLPYGTGVVGTAAATGEPVLASNVADDPHWVPHPDLPETKGELAVPIKWQDEVLGVLDVQSDKTDALSNEDQMVLMGLAGQIASAIESARLLGQAQDALAQTEALYESSRQVINAETMDDVLQALIQSTALQRSERANFLLFDRPFTSGEQPDAFTVKAVWERSGEEPSAPVGTRYDFDQFPAARVVSRHEPTIVKDVSTDERLDEATRDLILNRLGTRSISFWPLVVGEQWIGLVTNQASRVLEFNEDEIRQTTSIVGQAATVIQNQLLLEQTRARARREHILHEITTRMRGFTDPETIARVAVRELGTAIGRPTFIRLGSQEELSQAPEKVTGGAGKEGEV